MPDGSTRGFSTTSLLEAYTDGAYTPSYASPCSPPAKSFSPPPVKGITPSPSDEYPASVNLSRGS